MRPAAAVLAMLAPPAVRTWALAFGRRQAPSAFGSYRYVGTASSPRPPRSALPSAASTAEDAAASPATAWPTDRVRSAFVEYFSALPSAPHTPVPSSACAPLNDPTLLFTNAGMNQFKPIFLGQADPNGPLAGLERAVNAQKCIRAGGKHNDLEDVGRDTYHHTFFEMLGTWSFGDYFKEEAIGYAWELLTKVYGIDENRLYATYFSGDASLGLESDEEARQYWLRFLPDERVIGCDSRDNFWEMGDTGPCGPCSEIHYDRIGNRDASALVNEDDPEVIEIWNIVFVQYNRDERGLSTLPKQHIDTGMGLERLVSLLQDVPSNYDTDAFTAIFHNMAGRTGDGVGPDDVDLRDTAYRAVADHARALTFALADGAVPSNEGRGYVLRRILRRATRYGQQILKAEPGFFTKLVPTVIDVFGEAYPELVANSANIIEIIDEEEKAFSTMLDRGIKFFNNLQSELKSEKVTQVSGDKAFFLYDSLGFPVDLTELMAEEAGLTVDTDGFKNAMEEQKRRSREARFANKAGGGKPLELIAEQTSWLADRGIAATDDGLKFKEDSAQARVEAIFGGDDGFLEAPATPGGSVGIILDSTPFYAEAGGQETDVGTLRVTAPDGSQTATFVVTNVRVFGGYVLHTGFVESGEVPVGASVRCEVDYDVRGRTAPNHTVTHLLNAALRKVLGDTVDQRGSLCNAEKLRFDFSQKKAMTLKQLVATEEITQKYISDALPVEDTVMPLAEAMELPGVRAVFGESYPDPVRVISVAGDCSTEFCGGTHLTNTREAGAFVLLEETAVAKGIRRITGVTGAPARRAIEEGKAMEDKVAAAESYAGPDADLQTMAVDLRKEIDASVISAPLKATLRGRIELLQKKAADAKKALLAMRVDRALQDVKERVLLATAAEERVMVTKVDVGADGKAANKVIEAVRKVAPDVAFMGVSEEEEGSGGKVLVFAAVPDAMVEGGLAANDWVNEALAVAGGRGGGRPNAAQGQAKECTDVGTIIFAGTVFATDKTGANV